MHSSSRDLPKVGDILVAKAIFKPIITPLVLVIGSTLEPQSSFQEKQ